jgi:hypothetical protein
MFFHSRWSAFKKKMHYVHASRLSPAETLDASDSDAMLETNAKLIF